MKDNPNPAPVQAQSERDRVLAEWPDVYCERGKEGYSIYVGGATSASPTEIVCGPFAREAEAWTAASRLATPEPAQAPVDKAAKPIELLADVMHLWVDGYISKNPQSSADVSISEKVFNKVQILLESQGIEVDYCGWRYVAAPMTADHALLSRIADSLDRLVSLMERWTLQQREEWNNGRLDIVSNQASGGTTPGPRSTPGSEDSAFEITGSGEGRGRAESPTEGEAGGDAERVREEIVCSFCNDVGCVYCL